jgi:uncharacterized protein (TIGR01777 family)
MKEVVLITGANGVLANYLAEELESNYSIRFLTRKVNESNEFLWDLTNNYIDPKAFNNVNHIIHLAGSSIADNRWTEKIKQMIYSSRVDSSQLILEVLKKNNQTIDTFISASAIGYYGMNTTDTILNEESPNGTDFLSDVCNKWEGVAHSFSSENVANRMSIVRIGIIFTPNEGALKKIIQPINLGIGSGIGSGNQWMPWIHISDLCGIFKFLLAHKEISGTFNAVSSEHTTNIELTRKIAKVLKRKIILPNIPKFVMKLIFGEMSVILLKGSRVSSDKIIKKGFNFKYENLNMALRNILKTDNK